MSTLAVVRGRVRVKLNDADAREGELDIVEVDHAIADACIEIGAGLLMPHVYLTSALTIAANADTFTLPTAAQTGYASLTQYGQNVRVWLQARNYYLTKRTPLELDAMRSTTTTATVDIPTDFCLWPEMDNDMQARCYPRSREAEACDLFVSLVPDDLRDAADMDAANVRFSRLGETALVYHAAAMLAGAMTDEDLKARRLSQRTIASWGKRSERLCYLEEVRLQSAGDVGRLQRWV